MLVFRDKLIGDRSAISMRDGVHMYLGSEIGQIPADKMFSVYRSPATLANAAMHLTGIPIINDHTIDGVPNEAMRIGEVLGTTVVPVSDPAVGATMASKNALRIKDGAQLIGNEFSLEYKSQLIPSSDPSHDFEQINLIPQFLAVVEHARCGPMCSFTDSRATAMSAGCTCHHTTDAHMETSAMATNDPTNIEEIIILAKKLPEALRRVPMDQLKKAVPMLRALIEAAGAETPSGETTIETTPDAADAPATVTPETAPPPVTLVDPGTADTGHNPDSEQLLTRDQAVSLADKRAEARVKQHTVVLEKARKFLPADYVYGDKPTEQIMRDAIATHDAETYSDAELPIAFRMLKPFKDYETFGSGGGDDAAWADIANQEIGAN